MDFPINEKLRDFFLGDDGALEEIFWEYRSSFVKYLIWKFPNLPLDDLEDIVSDWFTKIYDKVQVERMRAEIEGEINKLSLLEIADKKIQYCSEKIRNPGLEKPFLPWVKTILFNEGLDLLRYKKLRQLPPIGSESQLEKFETDDGDGVEEVDFVVLMDEFKQQLVPILDEQELLYFQIWLEYDCNPDGKVVAEIFKNRLNKELVPAAFTFIKQRLLRLCYLILLKIEYDAHILRKILLKLINFNHTQREENEFFDVMMRVIWKDFDDDAETKKVSQQKVSPALWGKWKQAEHKKKVQNEILRESFAFFRHKNPSPKSCRTIKMCADDMFGAKVKEFFYEGENEDE